MATSDVTTSAAPTPERLLLRAILLTMKPERRERILDMIGDTTAENVISLRSPSSSAERNALVADARRIAGEW